MIASEAKAVADKIRAEKRRQEEAAVAQQLAERLLSEQNELNEVLKKIKRAAEEGVL